MATPLKTISFTVPSGGQSTDAVNAVILDENGVVLTDAVVVDMPQTAEWLVVNPSRGTTPFSVVLTATAGGRPVGMYQTQPTALTNPLVTAIELPLVTMEIQDPTPPPPPIDTTAPVVTIQAPLNGQVLTAKKVTIRAEATDNTSVTRMDIYINGVFKAGAAGNTIVWQWNTASFKRRTVTIDVHAIDTSGNVGRAAITVQVA